MPIGRVRDVQIGQEQRSFDARTAMEVVRERGWPRIAQPQRNIGAPRIDGHRVRVPQSLEQLSAASCMRRSVLQSHDLFELIEEFPFAFGVTVNRSAGAEANELLVAANRPPSFQFSPTLSRGRITVGPELAERRRKLQAEQLPLRFPNDDSMRVQCLRHASRLDAVCGDFGKFQHAPRVVLLPQKPNRRS